MTDLILIEELKQHLVDSGIVRADPKDVGSSDGPPCWLDPKDGPPQPAGADTSAVTLRRSGGLPTGHLEGFLSQEVIEIIVRANHSKRGELLHRTVRGVLDDHNFFMLGQLRVQWCLRYRSVQPVPLPDGAVATSYDTTASFMFQVRVADLTV